MKIKLYSIDDSPKCLVVKNYLRAQNVDFEEVVVETNDFKVKLENLTGKKEFPIIKADEKLIVGFKQEELRHVISWDCCVKVQLILNNERLFFRLRFFNIKWIMCN